MSTTQANIQLEKRLNVVAWIVSAVVLLLVGLMRRYKFETDLDFGFLRVPPCS
ncbi:MAG: hypothetical protein IPJ82_14940 [Lewinellaceae bacterium]|nr:hypothetical protein [Lewinellaceae bacterium]